MNSLPRPTGIFADFIAPQCVTLVVKEKIMSWSGDDFTISTVDGRPLFKVEGKALSLSGRKRIMDMRGTHIFTIRKKHLALHATYYLESPSEQMIFEVKGKFSLIGSKSTASFISLSKEAVELEMKGNFLNTKAEIVDQVSGLPAVTISRDWFNGRELLGGQQTYHVTIAANMDMAIAVAMCICLDERKNDK
ncbi:tubby C-terminal-like domain-containing protein [Pseudomassariella vexata]|uniref:Tubby C-terminal-like domain-containing protein n=1 Tax=Pseudomassariella vexata TaxID=1141098 RepID=A0A1Y2EJR3_9PEZI|nr:tubby C-terminal-like domain-containing protein [Pseudomassariella vexata]ORY71045.1 tubby C-terminal-like domain-containing protein [Pseudomassariella vexata]